MRWLGFVEDEDLGDWDVDEVGDVEEAPVV